MRVPAARLLCITHTHTHTSRSFYSFNTEYNTIRRKGFERTHRLPESRAGGVRDLAETYERNRTGFPGRLRAHYNITIFYYLQQSSIYMRIVFSTIYCVAPRVQRRISPEELIKYIIISSVRVATTTATS